VTDAERSDEAEGPEEPALPDGPLPGYYRRVKGGGATTMLSVAMLAAGRVLEPDKVDVEIVHPSSADDEGLDLDFGDLPDLS